MRIGILVFDDVEVLDACGPFEVFSVAARILPVDALAHPLTVTLISAHEDRTTITARGGLRMIADCTTGDAPPLDLLVVPGGVTTQVEQDHGAISWLHNRRTTPVIASVCTGVFLLAEAGILTDHTVTTHWEDQAELAARFPNLTVVDGPRWVQQNNLFTSAGISAGIDLALHLMGTIDQGLPTQVARQMDYVWHPDEATAPTPTPTAQPISMSASS